MNLAHCGHVINCTEILIYYGISFTKLHVIIQVSVNNCLIGMKTITTQHIFLLLMFLLFIIYFLIKKNINTNIVK